MKDSSMSQLVACVLLLTMLLTTSAISASGLTIRAELTHVDSGRGFTRWELVNRMAARSRARAARIHHRFPRGGGGGGGGGRGSGSGGSGGRGSGGGGSHGGGHPATVPVEPGTTGQLETEYNIHFGIGTPQPQHVALELDTGSDLVWTQCQPCPGCFDQPFPVFDTTASKTIKSVKCLEPVCRENIIASCRIGTNNCFYLDSYGDKSMTAGQMFRDTFTFKAPNGKGTGTVVVPNFAFGCGLYNIGQFTANESGIAGFGRGPQSLPSQLKVGKFSYCFTSMFESPGKSSPVFLGTPDDLRAHATGPIQSTPLPKYGKSSYYYLLFKGITVGTKRLPVDESVFAVKSDGTGGTFIDSGTGITSFPKAVYDQLAIEFASQMHLPLTNASAHGQGLLCFSLPAGGDETVPPVPKLVFHLEGADMDLPQQNYLLEIGEVVCLMINSGLGGDMTVIGNFQQQNMHIVHDVQNNKLLFAPAECDKM